MHVRYTFRNASSFTIQRRTELSSIFKTAPMIIRTIHSSLTVSSCAHARRCGPRRGPRRARSPAGRGARGTRRRRRAGTRSRRRSWSSAPRTCPRSPPPTWTAWCGDQTGGKERGSEGARREGGRETLRPMMEGIWVGEKRARERQTETELDRQSESERERERECVCVCVRERERERDSREGA